MLVKCVFYHFLQAINKSIQDNSRWGGFVCANNPICSEVDPVFWLVKSLKPHNDDSQSGPWLTEEVRGTHQLLPMNHKERISEKKTYEPVKKQDKKKTLQRQGGSVGSHYEERSCWRRNRRWSSPLLNFWWQGQFQPVDLKTETNGVSLAIVQT